MIAWGNHLPVMPVLIPLLAAAGMLLLRDTQRKPRLVISAVALILQIVVALSLLEATSSADHSMWPGGVGVYLLGDWPAPFGIVIVVDRLSALMLSLTSLLGACCWIYSTARWDRAGAHFHSLFQLLLMGLNGAFLAGDLFNLFVCFEILLTASYGLMLHGSGMRRVSAGMHYIAVNLIASFMLLIAIAMIYGLTGTLNMADLAIRVHTLSTADRQLFDAAAAILGVAFLIKAAAWPVNFWLPNAYTQACTPVAAMFVIMTKVGIYALLRIGALLLPAGAPAAFGGDWMFPAGIATLAFGTLGMLASQHVERIAAYAIIVSSGTLLAALGMPGVALTGPALYYLISSVLALGALFMVLEMVSRTQTFGADLLAISLESFDLDDPDDGGLSDEVVGVALPAAMAFLGLSFFACSLLIIGLPPLSGFVAKFSLLSAALNTAENGVPTSSVWLLVGAMLGSGFVCLIALSRSGARLFWIPEQIKIPRLRLSEATPVIVLLGACIALTWKAGPAMAYLEDTAYYLDRPQYYIQAVLHQDTRRPRPAEVSP
ncbi:MAG: monovalent cation/H+ antiporter subunit D [Alcaligenaceae bacterium]|nr:monovalent cation/H+ antiporter subunit D [Alcaligenaceae bacterium]